MYEETKPPSSQHTGSHLFGPKIPVAPRQPDPSAHARALVESYGMRGALDIARNNAFFTQRREDYWPRVLAAMRKDQRVAARE